MVSVDDMYWYWKGIALATTQAMQQLGEDPKVANLDVGLDAIQDLGHLACFADEIEASMRVAEDEKFHG